MRKPFENDMFDLELRFESEIEPICRKNDFTLHELFDYLRVKDLSLYSVLSGLWRTPYGKEYLRSKFRGGHLRKGGEL